MLELVALLSLLVSLVTGSLAITLTSLFTENRIVLIIIACSSILYSFTVLIRLVLFMPLNKYFIRSTNIFFQILTLACSVQYFNETTKHVPHLSKLNKHLTIAFQSALLFSLFFNGIFTGCDNSERKVETESQQAYQDDEEKKLQSFNVDSGINDRFIPLKNSTQTLTPDMANGYINSENKANWVMSEFGKTKVSDEISNSSVVRHQLTPIKFPYRSRSSTSNSTTDKIHKKTSIKFRSPKLNLKSPFKYKKNHVIQENLENEEKLPNNKTNLTARYVTRLSTISDLPKSFLNMLSNASSTEVNRVDRPVSAVMESANMRNQQPLSNETLLKSRSQMKLERDAIERMDHTLLPSFLNIPCPIAIEQSAPSIKTEATRPLSPLITQNQINEDDGIEGESTGTLNMDHDNRQKYGDFSEQSINILEQTELADISEVPGESFLEDSYELEKPTHIELPQNVTLDMWEKEGHKYLERADSFQNQRINRNKNIFTEFQLGNDEVAPLTPISPVLNRKSNFKFPLKQIIETPQNPNEPHISQQDDMSSSDAVSELDRYLKELSITEEDPGHLLEESFRNDNPTSTILENSYRELRDAENNHSPTKSLVSIISSGSMKQQKSQNAINNLLHRSTSHVKSNSQVSFRFPTNGSNAILSSTQSSPIKSNSFKRFSKKLSISNLNDPHSHSRSTEHPFDMHNVYAKEHNRGRSVDFTYLRSIQSQHSPSKSVTTTNSIGNSSRRNSAVPESATRTISKIFQNKHGDSTYLMNSEDLFNITLKHRTELSLSQEQAISDDSAIESQESGPSYPDSVVGEYDRERWTTLQNLQLEQTMGEVVDEFIS
ncbi:similar to Saccharomyces cerevisiae YJL051W IRC8 Bud tip localized protein of unknown function [Maudiozyma barnettii]|uniref:Uncharacterized protein n=1 Tax=Maudiozyma barnettii TaxID=61262 RepID=A0A8H2VDG7_9SACH|nr:Irc8p [Kazachstania barnettii]CAB4253274.1 similar to Saccharomyces cerevisiae YJL051W IRC8 Bud tip localized protein of unknown function [Kazachstania barnettii]CAD1780190.1 similar to Saccharomyces cerevisiae YJL051W IRC8 Bud tip localized protein of unknown function [Kazachstania barnettii]